MLAAIIIPVSLTATALAIAQLLGRDSIVKGVLGALLAVYVELIAVAALLSLGGRLTPGWASALLVSVAILTVAAWSRERPSPRWREAARRLMQLAANDRLLLALVVLVAVSLSYMLALSLFTPQAEGDSLAYHLARAAYWVQHGGLGAIPGNTDPRIDGSPPGAEIAIAFSMLASGGVRFAGLVQFIALLGTMVAIFGLARRLGFDERPAVFGALLFPTTSVVLMQAPTALNDLVVAWLAVTAAYFLVGSPSSDRWLGAVSVGCLALTKVTAAVAIPGVLLVVLAAKGFRHTARSLVAVTICLVPAFYWLEAGPQTASTDAVGGVHADYVGIGGEALLTVLARVSRLAVENLELPGAAGRDALLYVVVGIVVLIAIALRAPRRWTLVAAAGITATAMLAPIASWADRGNQKVWILLGRPDLALLDSGRRLGVTESTFTWYGPVAVVLIVLATTLLVTGRGRRRLAVVAASPIVWLFAYGVVDHLGTTTGRFLMGSVAISSSTWGIALARRPLATWAIPTAFVGVALTVIHFGERPMGIRLFEAPAPPSVWHHPYVEGVGVPPGLPSAMRFVERNVPVHGRLALGDDIMPGGFFGSNLTRTVIPVRDLVGAQRSQAEWVLLRPDVAPTCSDGWRRIDGFSTYVVAFRRSAGARC